MKRLDLINKIIDRKKQLNITVENLAKLSNISVRTVNRVLKNEDIKLSTIEKITNLLGLDFAGDEQISLRNRLDLSYSYMEEKTPSCSFVSLLFLALRKFYISTLFCATFFSICTKR
jgi:transcriptional regulator with XRE-family HTH domain